MNVYFRHGPWDGRIKFYHLRTRTIMVAMESVAHHYRRTPRRSQCGAVIYQYLGLVREEVKVA